MTVFRWLASERPPDDMTIRQVYAYCFDDTGRVLLYEDNGIYGLPGGTPEPGETAQVTLAREGLEETQITLAAAIYLGYQEVTSEEQPPFSQLRYAARIERFLPRRPDPDNGRTYGRLLTPIARAPALLNWGVSGLLQSADAARAAYRLGVDPEAAREDTWRN